MQLSARVCRFPDPDLTINAPSVRLPRQTFAWYGRQLMMSEGEATRQSSSRLHPQEIQQTPLNERSIFYPDVSRTSIEPVVGV